MTIVMGGNVTMANNQFDLAKIDFTTRELRGLPPAHAAYFVISCLAINEIAVIQKVLLMALNTRTLTQPLSESALQEIAYAQTAIIERNLGSKVIEYIKMTDKHNKLCRKKGENGALRSFLDEAKTTTSRLKGEPGYELALWYRNKVTSHYDVAEINSLIQSGDLGSDSDAHPIYLHKLNGNSFYIIGEQVVLAKLSEYGAPPLERIRSYEDWVLSACEAVVKLHQAFCIALTKTYFPTKQARTFPIAPAPHLVGGVRDVCLPILWKGEPESS
jgi:hypothetical protein